MRSMDPWMRIVQAISFELRLPRERDGAFADTLLVWGLARCGATLEFTHNILLGPSPLFCYVLDADPGELSANASGYVCG